MFDKVRHYFHSDCCRRHGHFLATLRNGERRAPRHRSNATATYIQPKTGKLKDSGVVYYDYIHPMPKQMSVRPARQPARQTARRPDSRGGPPTAFRCPRSLDHPGCCSHSYHLVEKAGVLSAALGTSLIDSLPTASGLSPALQTLQTKSTRSSRANAARRDRQQASCGRNVRTTPLARRRRAGNLPCQPDLIPNHPKQGKRSSLSLRSPLQASCYHSPITDAVN